MEIVTERLGSTLQLLSLGLLLAIVLGVLGGVACAVWKDKVPDFVISMLAVVGQSMPSFWLGILLIQFFALDLQLASDFGAGRLGAYGPARGDARDVPGAELHPGDAHERAGDGARAVRRHGTRPRRGIRPGRSGGTYCPMPSIRW